MMKVQFIESRKLLLFHFHPMDVLKSILMYVNVACVAMYFIGKGPARGLGCFKF